MSSELYLSLKKKEFPYNARDALIAIEELLVSTSLHNRNKQNEMMMEIISEFVFIEDRRGLRRLELMLVISDHMKFSVNEASRNSLFLLLFPVTPQGSDRARILVSLVSLAISSRNSHVLTAAAVLLQLVGSSSPFAVTFARSLINEFFLLVAKDSPAAAELPKIAPLFTANFLTAAAESFDSSKNSKLALPQDHFIHIVVNWLMENPKLCLSPLMEALQPNLLHGAILMPAPAPHVGLLRWCVVALVTPDRNEVLFTQLATLILDSLSRDQLCVSGVVPAPDLATIIAHLKTRPATHPNYQSAVDLLVQIIDVALTTGSLSGPKQDLWRQLEQLPPNPRLRLLLENHIVL